MKIKQDYAGLGFARAAAVLANESQRGFAISQNLQQVGFTYLVESVAEYEDVCMIVLNGEDGWDTHGHAPSLAQM